MTFDMNAAENAWIAMLKRVFGDATQDASAALRRWTRGVLSLTLDDVCEIDLVDVCGALGLGDELMTMVVLDTVGELGGQMLLVFDENHGRRFAATLLERDTVGEGPWDELEKSALTETGNILVCSYINALSRLLGVDLRPSPPCFIQDFGAAVLQQVLVTQAVDCDRSLVCRTGFHTTTEQLNWQVLFMPDDAMRQQLKAVCAVGPNSVHPFENALSRK